MWASKIASASAEVNASAAVAPRKKQPVIQPARFAVVSDAHLYDTRLGDSGAAFEAYLAQDPKFISTQQEIELATALFLVSFPSS